MSAPARGCLTLLAAVPVRAAFVVFVLCADNPVNVDTFFSAPVQNTNDTIRHFNRDPFRLFGTVFAFFLEGIIRAIVLIFRIARSAAFAFFASVPLKRSPAPVFLQCFG